MVWQTCARARKNAHTRKSNQIQTALRSLGLRSGRSAEAPNSPKNRNLNYVKHASGYANAVYNEILYCAKNDVDTLTGLKPSFF